MAGFLDSGEDWITMGTALSGLGQGKGLEPAIAYAERIAEKNRQERIEADTRGFLGDVLGGANPGEAAKRYQYAAPGAVQGFISNMLAEERAGRERAAQIEENKRQEAARVQAQIDAEARDRGALQQQAAAENAAMAGLTRRMAPADVPTFLAPQGMQPEPGFLQFPEAAPPAPMAQAPAAGGGFIDQFMPDERPAFTNVPGETYDQLQQVGDQGADPIAFKGAMAGVEAKRRQREAEERQAAIEERALRQQERLESAAAADAARNTPEARAAVVAAEEKARQEIRARYDAGTSGRGRGGRGGRGAQEKAPKPAKPVKLDPVAKILFGSTKTKDIVDAATLVKADPTGDYAQVVRGQLEEQANQALELGDPATVRARLNEIMRLRDQLGIVPVKSKANPADGTRRSVASHGQAGASPGPAASGQAPRVVYTEAGAFLADPKTGEPLLDKNGAPIPVDPKKPDPASDFFMSPGDQRKKHGTGSPAGGWVGY